MTLLTNVHIGLLCPAGKIWREESYTMPYVIGLVGTVASHSQQVLVDTFSIVAAALQTNLKREHGYRKDVGWTS
jgi:hypothetical protein